MESVKQIRIALAGNPNVGKSVIFNQLTGLSQVVGNWPGKTVAKAEGKARFQNYEFNIIDLPGIYSLSTYSLEEVVSREYIVDEKPDYIINVIDANHLERNLFFTLQLGLLDRPIIIALNQYDLLQKRGFDIDIFALQKVLGIKVVPTVAVHNRGVHELLETIIALDKIGSKQSLMSEEIKYGREIEEVVSQITEKLGDTSLEINLPMKFFTLKTLEDDEICISSLTKNNPGKPAEVANILDCIKKQREELEKFHGHTISEIINAEIYTVASKIDSEVLHVKKPTKKTKWYIFIDHLTTHSFFGYIIMIFIMLGAYLGVFWFGDFISGLLDRLLEIWNPTAISWFGSEESIWYKIVWNGIIGGLFAGVGGVLPYVIPFFIFIEILQDTGYLPRAAYLMDRFMHRIGVHGKTIIPILLGFGCSVPAITATSIMETDKEKRRAIIITSMIPCSAITTIVMGLVAKYMGIGYALLLYLINFMIIVLVGKYLSKHDSKEDSELIIELHDFRKPNMKVIMQQSWHRSKEFIYMALPLIIVLGVILQILIEINALGFINTALSPITVYALGLPVGVGVYLLYGILRKELNLLLLEVYVTSLGLSMSEYMTPIQMITFTMVTILYVPCLSTIITIRKEVGGKFAAKLSLFQILLSVIVSGTIYWSYTLISFIFHL